MKHVYQSWTFNFHHEAIRFYDNLTFNKGSWNFRKFIGLVTANWVVILTKVISY